MIDSNERRTTYRCVVGHEISASDLESLTEIWHLDAGAEVRVCAEHGAPIAITVAPADGERDQS